MGISREKYPLGFLGLSIESFDAFTHPQLNAANFLTMPENIIRSMPTRDNRKMNIGPDEIQ